LAKPAGCGADGPETLIVPAARAVSAIASARAMRVSVVVALICRPRQFVHGTSLLPGTLGRKKRKLKQKGMY
jgi:hypothetical protein